jgi:hypothetical protein
MLIAPMRLLHILGFGALMASASVRGPARPTVWAAPVPSPHTRPTETTSMSDQYQLELIRSYASSGFAAVIAINSGALIAGLSQAGNLLEIFPPVAIAFAVFIWALGVTTGVATWGAAYRGVVAMAASDPREQMRWRGVAVGLFHVSLGMFILGFAVVVVALAT